MTSIWEPPLAPSEWAGETPPASPSPGAISDKAVVVTEVVAVVVVVVAVVGFGLAFLLSDFLGEGEEEVVVVEDT